MFQSTHPRGVRRQNFSPCRKPWGFNPRTRVGCDLCSSFLHSHIIIVSIHAPAWGATTIVFIDNIIVSTFQSTHPRGVRHRGSPKRGSNRRVSIHAPAWGATRAAPGCACREVDVSIHAPAWGATHHRSSPRGAGLVSIHAPAWGATAMRTNRYRRFFVSIHAPAWGATNKAKIDAGTNLVSIHAPAWGATSLSRHFV